MYGWRNPGLGTDLRVDPVTGASVDCDSFMGLFNSTCWGVLTTKGSQSYAYGNTPLLSTTGSQILKQPPAPPGPVATPANPNPLTTPPADEQMAQDTVNATIAQQMKEWQAQNQQFFANLDADINAANNANCTQSLSLANSLGVCDSTIYWTGGILAGVLALFAFAGRR